MAGKDTITLKVDVDAKAAASGLKPLTTALDQTKKAADQTEAELGKLGGDVGKIKINDAAIEQARKEITRLRTQIREDLSLNIDTDTSGSLKRISQLKRTIKSLDDETVELKLEADVSGEGSIADLAGAAGQAAPGLGRLAEKLSATKQIAGGAFAAVGAAAITVGKLAGDAEAARGQLDTLTGSAAAGADAFDTLNRFAADTPFAFEEITDSARQLLAAGIDTKDLQKNLLAIGDAASAVGAPIDEVALAYSQMVSKGKVSNEEMLQLQERGIDAYGILAKKMGLTVAEVNKLASESKLGRDAVDQLRIGMEKTYGGSMQRQAETLNGKLSTLGDTFKALGINVGNTVLPAFKDIVDAGLEVGGMLDTLMDKQAEWSVAAKESNASVADIIKGELAMNTGDLIEKFKGLGLSLGQYQDLAKHGDPFFSEKQAAKAELTAKAAGKVKEEQKKAAKETARQAEAAEKATKAAEAHEKAIKEANDELARMAGLYADIGGSIRTKVSFIFSEADFAEELDKLTGGKNGIDLPARLRLSGLDDLGEKQQQIVEGISGSVTAGLQEGARRAELNPNFDEVAWYNQVRRKTKGQLIQAGIDPKAINRVLTQVFGLPRSIPVGANMDKAQADVNAFNPKAKKLKITPEIQQFKPKIFPGGEVRENGSLPAIPAPITPKVDAGAGKTAAKQLGNVAAPAGKARAAKIVARVDGPSLRAVDARLDRLTADRHLTIFVHTQKVGGGGAAGTGALAGVTGVAAPSATTRTGLVATARALAAAPTSTALGPTGYAPGAQGAAAGAPTGTTPAPTKLRPSQTPVAVYLDGAVIADRLDLRRSLAAVESVRRVP